MTATPSRAVVAARKSAGALLLLSLGGLALAIGTGVRHEYREHSGRNDAEEGLSVILDHVASSYGRRGRLCGSSKLDLADGYRFTYLSEREQADVDAERDADVGFACLGVNALPSNRDMYSYESDGTTFRARAFRAYLFDPSGVLPRYEIGGRVEGGRLVVDPRIHRIAPGGPRFLGHPDAADD